MQLRENDVWIEPVCRDVEQALASISACAGLEVHVDVLSNAKGLSENETKKFDKNEALARTKSDTIVVNKELFGLLDKTQKTAAILHEVAHILMEHTGESVGMDCVEEEYMADRHVAEWGYANELGSIRIKRHDKPESFEHYAQYNMNLALFNDRVAYKTAMAEWRQEHRLY